MNRVLRVIVGMLSSRALPPLVLGFFLAIYIGIAFFDDETLISLMEYTRKIPLLAAVLALLPLNAGCRIIVELNRYLRRHRNSSGAVTVDNAELFDESVDLEVLPSFDSLEARLVAEGYKTARNGDRLAAWRGFTLLPARLLHLAALFCLLSGILVSLTSRNVERHAVIQGAPFPASTGKGGIVQKIIYRNATGPILANELLMEVANPQGGEEGRSFGVYPPARFDGAFVYPRYLGVALRYRFFAPELPSGYEKSVVLPLHPPGREASTDIAGTAYRITLSLAKPEDGSDPYMTGKMHFLFKLLKGNELLLTGEMPGGGEFSGKGYKLAIPDFRRMVMTDFVSDYGVLLVWWAGGLFVVALVLRMPIRLFFPRREMVFICGGGMMRACSYAEGAHRAHAGVFHEALDLLETSNSK